MRDLHPFNKKGSKNGLAQTPDSTVLPYGDRETSTVTYQETIDLNMQVQADCLR